MGLNPLAARGCASLAALLVLLCCSTAKAQSSASFPPEPGAAPAEAPPAQALPPPAAEPFPAPAPALGPPTPAPLTPSAPATTLPYPAPATNPGDPRPPVLSYREGLPVPPGYRVEERSASGLLIAGTTLFGAGYAVALLIAGAEDFSNGTGWLAVPVIGPWAAISSRDFTCDTTAIPGVDPTKRCVNDAFSEVRTIVFITVDGLVQATSVGLLLAGATSSQKELVRDDIKVALRPPLAGQRDWRLGLSGAF